MFKKTIIASLLAFASLATYAGTDFYVVVPLKGKKAVTPPDQITPPPDGTTVVNPPDGTTVTPPEPIVTPPGFITVTLNEMALPVAKPYVSYNNSLASALQVTGDPSFNSSNVAWKVVGGALPAGFAMTPRGTIYGTTNSDSGVTAFNVQATYNNQAMVQGYSIKVGESLDESRLDFLGTSNFGTIQLGASVSKTIYFRNTGTVPITTYPALSGSAATYYSYNGCGSQAAPATITGGNSCRMELVWAPVFPESLDGVSLSMASTTGRVFASGLLAGKAGAFDAAGAWSTTSPSTTPPIAADAEFGAFTSGKTSATRYMFVRNEGINGAENIGFTLGGDASQFKVVSVQKANNLGTAIACSPSAVISVDQVSGCKADNINGGAYPHLKVGVQYTPNTPGLSAQHTAVFTPTSNNGTKLPEAIAFTGTALNVAPAWSSSVAATTELTPTNTVFSTQTKNTTSATRYYYLRNDAAVGAQNVGFSLYGDTAQFQVASFSKISTANSATNCGSVAGASCFADEATSNGQVHLRIGVRYNPTSTGAHTLVVAPTSPTGTNVPAPLTLSAVSAFDPKAEWSTTYLSTIAPTVAFAPKAVGSGTNSPALYLRSAGSYGSPIVGISVSGDTSQFSLVAYKADNSGGQSGCGINNVADPLVYTVCAGSPHIKFLVSYRPTSAGSHSLTMTPYTTNGTELPSPLTVTGSAY